VNNVDIFSFLRLLYTSVHQLESFVCRTKMKHLAICFCCACTALAIWNTFHLLRDLWNCLYVPGKGNSIYV